MEGHLFLDIQNIYYSYFIRLYPDPVNNNPDPKLWVGGRTEYGRTKAIWLTARAVRVSICSETTKHTSKPFLTQIRTISDAYAVNHPSQPIFPDIYGLAHSSRGEFRGVNSFYGSGKKLSMWFFLLSL